MLLLFAPYPVSAQANFLKRVFGGKHRLEDDDDVPTARLSNGIHIPLVGLGVGNMMSQVVPAVINHAIREDKKIRLIDTSHISYNERYVAKGIVEGVEEIRSADKANKKNKKVEIHVVTKVWYTHLGYERTKLSVESSLMALRELVDDKDVDLKLHVLIHWPRCYDTIQWMHCDDEEKALPASVKEAGPTPTNDSWKESWKALEELYLDKSNVVASIGVSNFHTNELKELSQEVANIQPHIVQTSMWSLLYDPLLVEFCHRNHIHLMAFNTISSVIGKGDDAPNGYHHILAVGSKLEEQMRGLEIFDDYDELTATQVLLAWLVQHHITVIPRSTNLNHLKENSAVALAKIPPLSDEQVHWIASGVEALLSGDDMPHDAYVRITFTAKTKDLYLYWADHEYGGEIQLSHIPQGEKFEESSHPGHTFRLYDSETKENGYELYTVEGKYGDHYHVEL